MSALNVINLVKKYKTFEAVKSVDFSVQPGEIFGLLGPNGAGKTSIISMITTLESITAGRIEVFGIDVQKKPLQVKQKMGVVFQEVINSGYFNVEEILKFQSGFYGIWKNQERIDWVLEELALQEHRHKKVRQLSGGMKRRLMIAKALVHDPPLLLLDEPTAGVDIELRENLWRLARKLRDDGKAVLLTTHYLEEAEKLCDRVAIIHEGVLACVGPTIEIVKRFTQKKITVKLNSALKIQSSYLEHQEGFEYTFWSPSEKNIGEFLKEHQIESQDLLDMRIQEGTLEDAFLRVLKNQRTEDVTL